MDVLWVCVFYIFFVWVFMNILSMSTFIGKIFSLCFSSFDFDVRYFVSR